MKVFLNEITIQDTEVDFTEDDAWSLRAVSSVDECPPPPGKAAPRKIDGSIRLSCIDDVVVVNGHLDSQVFLLCSRCATPHPLACSFDFRVLFTKNPEVAGVARFDNFENKIKGLVHGYARHAHDEGEQLDITHLTEDFIDLSDVLAEQLRLQVPLQPLCRESCKGLCPQCGADLNAGRCACDKLAKQNPFSVLSGLPLKSDGKPEKKSERKPEV